MPDRHFASDNNAGAHPEVLAALAEANAGHVTGYGDDPYTRRAEAAFQALLGPQARVLFAFNGTGANVVALSAALRPHQAVICAEGAHLDVDECGAYERFVGGKLLPVPVENGKLTPAGVRSRMRGIGDPHHIQPAAISISQSSEVGTVYSLAELRALGDVAREHGLLFHVDGARLANAVVSLDTDLRAMLVDTGVDVLTFGGTKNGLLFGEAIVFVREHPALALLPYARKQGMQLASKMRFVAAQFEALLRDDLWRRSAAQANRMAQLLARRASAIDGVRIAYPVEANGVFAQLPRAAIEPLQRERKFYVWNAEQSVVRWMCSFDTTEEDVHGFADAVEREVRAIRAPA
jgi:threonine aldolase